MIARTLMCAVACLLPLAAMLPGCASPSGSVCLSTPVGEIKANWHSGIANVLAPPDACWEVDFLDPHGGVIDTIPGQGSKTLAIPPGTWDFDARWQQQCPAPATPPVLPGQATARPFPGPRFGRQIGSLTLDEDSHYRGARAKGPSYELAMADLQAVFDAGMGAPVPAGIVVDHFIDLDVTVDGITIISALPERFASFTIKIDGVIVSSIDADLNTAIEPIGNGWSMVATELPTSLLATARQVVIDQAGKTADQPLHIQFDL